MLKLHGMKCPDTLEKTFVQKHCPLAPKALNASMPFMNVDSDQYHEQAFKEPWLHRVVVFTCF